MVAVAPGSPGRCQALSYRAASSPARRRFSCAAAHYEAGDEYCSRADGCTSHRREVGARQLAFAASEAAHGTTETRSSTGTRRDVVGFGHRIFVAGSAQRGVRAVADGVRTLPRMARRRPLAADSGSAPAPPMMQTAHSRDRSGTVGLREATRRSQICSTDSTPTLAASGAYRRPARSRCDALPLLALDSEHELPRRRRHADMRYWALGHNVSLTGECKALCR
jgi:hypothetical protein